MIATFKLAGLNRNTKGCYATIDMPNEDWFHASFDETEFPFDRQIALFNYAKESKGFWSGKTHTCVVEFDGYSTGNSPINPKIIEINIL